MTMLDQGEGRPGPAASASDAALLEALRAGDEAAFSGLVQQYHGQFLRVASLYVSDQAVAEEVVQETWLGLLRGLDRFEGRSSLKTWLFRILTNIAKTKAVRERRSIPFSALWNADADPDEPSVEPERFFGEGHRWQGHWAPYPQSWSTLPEAQVLSDETRARVEEAIATLPPSQREVITLRDVQGWTSDEVCNSLSLSETNQRVLLHRARSKVRRALELYLGETASPR